MTSLVIGAGAAGLFVRRRREHAASRSWWLETQQPPGKQDPHLRWRALPQFHQLHAGPGTMSPPGSPHFIEVGAGAVRQRTSIALDGPARDLVA